ncbi:MAG: L-serine ammonia-lyase, iron-sulfur-dependent, subunit alpha [Treponema sp.]
MLSYHSIQELCAEAESRHSTIAAVVLADHVEQLEKSAEHLRAQMAMNLDAMLESIENGSKAGVRSTSGLTGGDAYRLKERIDAQHTLCGDLIANAIQMALAVSEINAAMGKIVAAPTAGSCGILPAALGALLKVRHVSKDDAVLSLFTAGAIGMVVAQRASIAGASGGCQAECGTASAMAAACIVELCGGTPQMVAHAVAITLKCVLGLVCDPVAGLVEIPCIKRNASGVSLAFTAAELALAGIQSAIPADEVIDTLKRVGDGMPAALKETAQGGLAQTPTALALEKHVFGHRTAGPVCTGCSGCA